MNTKEFQTVFNTGEWFNEKNFFIKWTKKDNSKFSVTVSKKLKFKKHERNREKRRVYEAIRKNLQDFKGLKAYIIYVIKTDTKDLSFKELEKEIITSLNKIYEKSSSVDD